MTDAERVEASAPPARRRWLSIAIASLLLTSGGGAVAFGVLNQRVAAQPPAAVTERAAAPPVASRAPGATTPPRRSSAGARSALPVSLRIPAINVRSDLTRVGLNPDGTLEVPQPGPDYDKAAWYEGSPAPGDLGPAVIEGHVDGKVNGPSVFHQLGALRPGQLVEVVRADRSVARFVVDSVRSYPKDDFPTLAVYGNTSRPELRLITCGGEFDRDRKGGGYRDNVVVFAHLA